MTRSLLTLTLVLTASAAFAGGEFHSLYIGEHQNSTPPTTGSAADYMESGARQTATGEEGIPATPPQQETQQQLPPADPLYPNTVTPQGHARITRVSKPDAPSAAAPQPAPARIGGFIKRDPAAQRYYEGPTHDRMSDAIADRPAAPQNAKAYKLWDSVAKPVQMNAAQINKAASVDDASSAANAEYERRILGTQSLAASGSIGQNSLTQPALKAELAGARDAVASPVAANPANEVFVSIDVSATEQAGLKDAVAGLTSAAGFRQDARFPPQSSYFAPGSAIGAAAKAATSVRGWMPADKISSAVTAPGVLRVQVDHTGARPESSSSAMTTLVVGLRIPAHASAGETFQQTISELSQSAHFRWTRTIGFQAVPNSSDVALIVVGEVPVTRIPKILEHPGVLKVGPAPLEPGAPVEQPKTPSRLEDFLSFTHHRAPLLIALTLLLLLPSVGGALLKLGQAFIPYER